MTKYIRYNGALYRKADDMAVPPAVEAIEELNDAMKQLDPSHELFSKAKEYRDLLLKSGKYTYNVPKEIWHFIDKVLYDALYKGR